MFLGFGPWFWRLEAMVLLDEHILSPRHFAGSGFLQVVGL